MKEIIEVGWLFIFLGLSWVCFYGLGSSLLWQVRSKLSLLEILVLGYGLGVVSFVYLGFGAAWLQARWLVWPVIVVVNIWGMVKYRRQFWAPLLVFYQQKWLTSLLLLGVVVLGLINFPSGWDYGQGLWFWSAQGHDGMWHLAVMQAVREQLPPANPIFSQTNLYNYHYLMDVLMGEFWRINPWFNSLDLYFRFFPVWLTLMLGLSVFALVERWQGSRRASYLAVVLTFFCGSFGYIVSWMKSGNLLAGETTFWSSQINTIMGNPPIAISMVLCLLLWLLIYRFLEKGDWRWGWLIVWLGATLAGYKILGAVVLLVGLGVAAVIQLISQRRWWLMGLVWPLGLSSLAMVKLITVDGGSFLIWLPWWFVRTMVVTGNHLDWIDLENRREYYASLHTWKGNLRVMQYELTALAIFLVGNLGIRVIGVYEIGRRLLSRRPAIWQQPFEISLMVAMLTGLLMVLLFVQNGITYNLIQFMQYFLLIFGIYAAITLDGWMQLLKPRWAPGVLLALVLVLAVPTVVGNLMEFYGPNKLALAAISADQLAGLDYLRTQTPPGSIVLNYPYNKYLRDQFHQTPLPIYAWYSTAYIPALGQRATYLSDEEQAIIMNYPYQPRLLAMQQFFEGHDLVQNQQFLSQNRIGYLYLAKDEVQAPFDWQANQLTKVYENSSVVIYRSKYSTN